MTDENLQEHKEKMLKFCCEKNLAIDGLIKRIERYVDQGGYEKRGARGARYSVARCSRLLIEALDAIKKLTGK
jgi:hypothetical protein